jgi:hypothetical protein
VYVGHLGFALGAYSFRRTIPLWLILIAAQLPDWFDAGYCFVGASRGPAALYTHGLYVVAGAAIILGAIYVLVTRDALGAFILGTVVVSHYGLDLFTGIKPTWPGGPTIGLLLYHRPVMDILLEIATIFIGWLLYRRTLPRDARDSNSVYAILVALIALQAAAGIAFYLNLGGQMKC